MVIDSIGVGGAERVALTLADTFLNNGHTIVFVTIDDIKIIDIDKRISLFSLSFENKFNKYTFNRKKMNLLLNDIQEKNGAFDFILVHLYKASRVMQYYDRVPCFHIIHSTQSKSALKEKRGFERWLTKRKIQHVYNNLDLVCVSEGVQTDLLENMHVKPKSISVIYNPFNINKIINKSIQKYDLPFKGKYIVFVGRLVKEKRVDYLIRAFSKSGISHKLLILGDGGERDELINLTKELGVDKDVFFLGTVSNPYKYIKNAEFLVLCSHHEGFGNVLVEALALQTPVISTNCPSGPAEILEHYTLDALVEDNFDNDALANKIKQWSIEALPVNSECMESFSDINIAQQYIQLYENSKCNIF